MGDDAIKRHGSGKHDGPAHAAPYPVSRLAPAHDLVDAAREIAQADHVLGTVVYGKLEVIAEQIRALQAQARAILDEARNAADLHRAECRFARRVGHVYHLYERGDGRRYFSMLSPDDWRSTPPHRFLGSFRLQADMRWTPAGEGAPEDASRGEALKALIAHLGEPPLDDPQTPR